MLESLHLYEGDFFLAAICILDAIMVWIIRVSLLFFFQCLAGFPHLAQSVMDSRWVCR